MREVQISFMESRSEETRTEATKAEEVVQHGPNTIRTPDGSLAVLGIAGGQSEKCQHGENFYNCDICEHSPSPAQQEPTSSVTSSGSDGFAAHKRQEDKCSPTATPSEKGMDYAPESESSRDESLESANVATSMGIPENASCNSHPSLPDSSTPEPAVVPSSVPQQEDLAKKVERLTVFSKELIDENFALRHQPPRCSFCQSMMGHTAECWTVEVLAELSRYRQAQELFGKPHFQGVPLTVEGPSKDAVMVSKDWYYALSAAIAGKDGK
jgi:hypothetical protein